MSTPPNGPLNSLNKTSSSSSSSRIMLAIGSRLQACYSTSHRCMWLILCSPILLPFICATFPLLFAAELLVKVFRKRNSDRTAALLDPGEAPNEEEDEEAQRLRRCEEGMLCRWGGEEERGEVGLLLQRYLEDQLRLVGSVYDCGRDGDRGDCEDCRGGGQNPGDSSSPFLDYLS